MSYILDISLNLGSASTGLTLKAQLVDTGGANVGSAVTTGFTEIGLGNYLWHYASFPDGHRGGVKFLNNSGGALLAFVAINPGEFENADAKTSAAKLASDGLNSISTTSPTTVAANFREMMILLYRRYFKKSTITSSLLKTYDDAGTTVVTTQSVTDDGTTQTVGSAS